MELDAVSKATGVAALVLNMTSTLPRLMKLHWATIQPSTSLVTPFGVGDELPLSAGLSFIQRSPELTQSSARIESRGLFIFYLGKERVQCYANFY